MARQSQRSDSGSGRITRGLRANTLVDQTLEFVKGELAGWRDDPTRVAEESEEKLNAQFCKYLNVSSRKNFPMIYFHHEEKQTEGRRVDVSALPSNAGFVGDTYYSIYNPLIVFEGKRLPAPTREREREYVTGVKGKSGGIQRFKLGLHGAKHPIAALVGYIQEGTAAEWFERINAWVLNLKTAPVCPEEKWLPKEQLMNFVDDVQRKIAFCSSHHPRVGKVATNAIQLEHFWVVMERSVRQ